MSNTGSGTSSQAVLLNGTPTSLQNLSGVLSSIAKGVNRHGVVVGEFGSATKSGAFVYALNDGAQMIDLDTRLVPGGPIERVKVAFAVSDSGIIAAIGEDSNLANVGVLLLPN
jgi:probable HAF family extracellular repeat protein